MYLFLFISIITATYIDFIIISVLIIVHELGHFLAAKYFNIETDKIYIYPLGGISKFNMPLNVPVYKEFIILIMGPLFQNIGYYLLNFIINNQTLLIKYHIGILVFNLLPIYPLDGGKLINLFFSNIIPYKASYKITIIISYLITIIILFINKQITINMIFTYIFLLYLIRKEESKTNYIYNKFLLERYLYNYNFSKDKIISHEKNFYRTKNNIIKIRNKYYNEHSYLKEKYQKKYKKYWHKK